MSQEWTGLRAVVEAINSADDPAAQLRACMQIILASVKLSPSDASDAIQEAFLLHESLSRYEIAEIVAGFKDHLRTFEN